MPRATRLRPRRRGWVGAVVAGATAGVVGILQALVVGLIVGLAVRIAAPREDHWAVVAGGIARAFTGAIVAALLGLARASGINVASLILSVVLAAAFALVARALRRRARARLSAPDGP